MRLPASWVDELFSRLGVRYGVAFTALYRDLNIADVKDDWAESLGVCVRRPEAIKHALEFLPEKPPNVIQFRTLCMEAMKGAAYEEPALPAPPDVQADPQRVAALIAGVLDSGQLYGTPNQVMLQNLYRIRDDGQRRLTRYQCDAIAACEEYERTRGESGQLPGGFKPVPRELWPKAMREEVPA